MSDERFGDAAVRLFGIAASALGWRPAEFWDATPRELATALQVQTRTFEPPDKHTINRLRHRFPD